MSGGYISCGDFRGEDKSGSAITGVFEALPEYISPENRYAFINEVLEPLQNSIENGDHMLIYSPDAKRLLPLVELLYEEYKTELGAPEPWNAPQVDEDRGIDPIDAKWGKGIGWRYYCLHDLRSALRLCVETDDPVCISFD
jgi:hypothetical protein